MKSRVRPMLGFKSFYNARRMLLSIDLLSSYKRQYRVPASFGSNSPSVWSHALDS
jgi:hypothetical protein